MQSPAMQEVKQAQPKSLSYWAQISDQFEQLEFVYEFGVVRLRNLLSLMYGCPIIDEEAKKTKLMEGSIDELQTVILTGGPLRAHRSRPGLVRAGCSRAFTAACGSPTGRPWSA